MEDGDIIDANLEQVSSAKSYDTLRTQVRCRCAFSWEVDSRDNNSQPAQNLFQHLYERFPSLRSFIISRICCICFCVNHSIDKYCM